VALSYFKIPEFSSKFRNYQNDENLRIVRIIRKLESSELWSFRNFKIIGMEEV
jgi:hypothetical protein